MMPILALEKKIETERLNYMKEYYKSIGKSTKGITKANMLEIYSCLVVKTEIAEKRKNESI